MKIGNRSVSVQQQRENGDGQNRDVNPNGARAKTARNIPVAIAREAS